MLKLSHSFRTAEHVIPHDPMFEGRGLRYPPRGTPGITT